MEINGNQEGRLETKPLQSNQHEGCDTTEHCMFTSQIAIRKNKDKYYVIGMGWWGLTRTRSYLGLLLYLKQLQVVFVSS
jgi:hypothetical protein